MALGLRAAEAGRPADGAGVHQAKLDQGGIEVRAEVGGRKPTEALPRNLTPIKITIKNTTNRGIHISLDEIMLSDGNGKLRNMSIDDIHLWRPEPSVGLLPGAPPALPALVPFSTKKNLRIGSPEYFTALRGKHPEKKVVEQSALKTAISRAAKPSPATSTSSPSPARTARCTSR